MSIFDLASTVAGFFGNKSKNNQAKVDMAKQTALAGQQTDIADLIRNLTADYAKKGTSYTDPFGGGTSYDPATGKWVAKLGAGQQSVQDASLAEELARNTGDMAIRREGLHDQNRLREDAVGRADAAGRQMDMFNSGVGKVDPNRIAGQSRLDRTRAVNSGFDDAQRAAQTISLRTGAGAGDALTQLARSRASANAQAMGSPEVEGLQTAEGINTNRGNNAQARYGDLFAKGSGFYDSSFAPSQYGQQATDNLFKTQALDQNKFDQVTNGNASAAAIINGAATGLRGGNAAQMANTNYANTAQFLKALGQHFSPTGGSGGSGGGGGFDLSSLLAMIGG